MVLLFTLDCLRKGNDSKIPLSLHFRESQQYCPAQLVHWCICRCSRLNPPLITWGFESCVYEKLGIIHKPIAGWQAGTCWALGFATNGWMFVWWWLWGRGEGYKEINRIQRELFQKSERIPRKFWGIRLVIY